LEKCPFPNSKLAPKAKGAVNATCSAVKAG